MRSTGATRGSLVCLILLIVGSLSPRAQVGGPGTGAIRRVTRPIPGHYIVVLKSDEDPSAVGREAAVLNRGRLRHVYEHALSGFAIQIPEAVARRLAQDPRVAYVEEDGETVGQGLSTQTAVPAWGLDRVDQRLRDYDQRYRYSADGTGVHVYVVDTGIRVTHTAFEGRATAVYSAVEDGIPAGIDCQGHGTHVAGIVGGANTGVAKGVFLHSVKALGCDNSGSWSDYIEALDWVAGNHRTPAVVNASIGGSVVTAAVGAIQRLVASGVTFVGAAGNSNSDACNDVPGAASAAITVASTTGDDRRASDSNWGSCVDLFAPGGNIYSASEQTDTGYVTKWGTSMAAPHVAGAAALYLHRHPAATPAEVRAALLRHATPGPVFNPGTSSPNRLLFTTPLGDIEPPQVAISAPHTGAQLRDIVDITASAADDVELATVRFSVDGVVILSKASAPYAMKWDTRTVADGTHNVTVAATDSAGNTGRSVVTVTVANGTPAVGTWQNGVVGSTPAGTSAAQADTLVMQGSGTDIWGTQDSFQFSSRAWTGDGDIVVRVAALTRPANAAFAMAGVTFRESVSPSSPHATLLVSTDGKLKFRRRTTAGGQTASDGPAAGTTYAPRWLKLSRRGSVFSAFVSSDALAWTPVHTPQTLGLSRTVQVGAFVLQSGATGFARGVFRNLGIGLAPAGWDMADVGAAGVVGETMEAAGAVMLKGGGTDLWATEDGFHFTYRRWSGDGELIARLTTLTAPGGAAFALAGVTMRASLDANAPHASLVTTTTGKLKFRRRPGVGTATLSDGPSAGSAATPQWLRLTRSGSTITAATSADGIAWTRVHTPQTVTLPPVIYVGVATLRNGGAGRAAATFTNVTVR